MTSYEDIAEIKSISTAGEGWYCVRGTRQSPELERVVAWAVITVATIEAASKKEITREDIIVGVPATDFSVSGNAPDQYTKDVAGYVQLSEADFVSVQSKEQSLDRFAELVWE